MDGALSLFSCLRAITMIDSSSATSIPFDFILITRLLDTNAPLHGKFC